MACYDPLSVPNPRIDFRYKQDNNFMRVPCGKCAGCRQSKRDDWFVRLFYEWESVKSDGVCVFPTFTYNPLHVPTVDTTSSEFDCLKENYSSFPQSLYKSFDKIGFQNFLKKLRKRLFRDGYTNDETGLKYFVVTEYGSSLAHQHLPHYHVLFFLERFVEPLILKRYFELAWSHRVKKADVHLVPSFIQDGAKRYFKKDPDNPKKYLYDSVNKYKNIYVPVGKGDTCLYLATVNKYGVIHYHLKNGNVSYSKDGATISSMDALEYVTKYLYKPSNFMESPDIKKLVDFLDSFKSLDNYPKDQQKAIERLRSVLPFSLKANEIGISLFDDLDIRSQLVTQYKDVIDNMLVPNKICIPGKEHYYKVPVYVINKLFYTQIPVMRHDSCILPDGSEIKVFEQCEKRILTELGKVCLQKRMRLKVRDMVNHYKVVTQPQFFSLLQTHVDRLLRTVTSETDFKMLGRFNNIKDVLQNTFSEIDSELLAVFTLKFENLSLYGYDPRVRTYSKDEFLDLFYRLVDGHLMTYNEVKEFYEAPMKQPKNLDFMINVYGTFNDLPIFDNYSTIAQAFNDLNSIVSIIHSISRQKKDKLSDDIRQYFNSLQYVP